MRNILFGTRARKRDGAVHDEAGGSSDRALWIDSTAAGVSDAGCAVSSTPPSGDVRRRQAACGHGPLARTLSWNSTGALAVPPSPSRDIAAPNCRSTSGFNAKATDDGRAAQSPAVSGDRDGARVAREHLPCVRARSLPTKWQRPRLHVGERSALDISRHALASPRNTNWPVHQAGLVTVRVSVPRCRAWSRNSPRRRAQVSSASGQPRRYSPRCVSEVADRASDRGGSRIAHAYR